jgi:type II secretory ATPase GspE/PulE/Tfp pilus assembly ATPase PilB-like protein
MTDTAIEFDGTAAPIVRRVNLLIAEAINLEATRVLLYPDLDAVGVRYRIAGEWVDRDRIPIGLLHPITARLAAMAAIDGRELTESDATEPAIGHFSCQVTWHRHHRVRVMIQPSPNGPTSQLDFTLVHT